MFHVFKDVYLDLDEAFTSLRFDSIAISDRWSKLIFLDPVAKFVRTYDSLASFEAQHANNAGIWGYLYTLTPKKSRIVIYLKPADYQKLQIQYWKSILKNPTAETVYTLHKLFTEDRWFKSCLFSDSSVPSLRDAARVLKVMSRENFDAAYDTTPVIDFLHTMSKSTISFEYLLANYFRDPNSLYAPVVLQKIKQFTWTNWIMDLEDAKFDLINLMFDVNNILPPEHHIDVSDASTLFASVSTNEYLSWIVDPNIHYSAPEYLEATYDKKIFKHFIYKLQCHIDDESNRYIDMIYNHQYAELLEEDVQRGLGSVYTQSRYQERMNQVFTSWLYSVKRSGDLSPLDAYELA